MKPLGQHELQFGGSAVEHVDMAPFFARSFFIVTVISLLRARSPTSVPVHLLYFSFALLLYSSLSPIELIDPRKKTR